MAENQLTTEFVVVDRTTPVLDKISKSADNASAKIDHLLSSLNGFGKVSWTDFFSQSIHSAETAISGITSAPAIMSESSEALKDFYQASKGFSDTIAEKTHSAKEAFSRAFDGLVETFGVDLDDRSTTFGEIVHNAYERIMQPFRNLVDVGFKIQGAVGTLDMIFSKIGQMAKAVDANTMQNARFKMLANAKGYTGEAADKESSRMINASYAAASELGMSASEFSNNLMRFANNSAFSSFDEANDFATLLNKSFIASGSSASEADSAVRQMLQGLSKGRLGGEDLMSILSAAPQVSGLLERAAERKDNVATGTYTGQARQLGTEGKLTADVIKDAVFGARAQLEQDFDSIPLTFDTAITRIKNRIEFNLKPIQERISKLLNSKGMQRILKGAEKLIDFILTGVDLISRPIFWLLDKVGEIVDGIVSLFTGESHDEEDEAAEAVVNQTAVMKLQEERTNNILEDQLDVMSDSYDVFKGFSEDQVKLFQRVESGLGTITQIRDNAAKNYEENSVNEIIRSNDEMYRGLFTDKAGNALTPAEYFGYKKNANGSESFARDVSLLDYKWIYDNFRDRFVDDNNNDILKIRSTSERNAALKKASDARNDLNKLTPDEQLTLFAMKNSPSSYLGEAIEKYAKKVEKIATPEEMEALNKLTQTTVERFKDGVASQETIRKSGSLYSNQEKQEIAELLYQILKSREEANESLMKQIELFDEAVELGTKNTPYIKATERNTRSLHIDRDSILFMKEMATAEIINRYNNIASSVVQNNTFNNTPSAFRAGNLSRAMLQAADGRQLAQ